MKEKDLQAIDDLAAVCRANAPRLGEALRLGGETPHVLEIGGATPFDEARLPIALHGPGVLFVTGSGEAGFAWLVPTDRLPGDWNSIDDHERRERLRLAAADLSAIVGESFSANGCEARQVESLAIALPRQAAGDVSRLVPLTAANEDLGGIYMIGPIAIAGAAWDEAGESTGGDGRLHRTDAAAHERETAPTGRATPDAATTACGHGDLPPVASRLMKLPVRVVVQLARKKIEMRQLLSMSVGTLITFDKACEAPLDLFVNNRPYGQGETVKIGEKFGLKIDRVGAPPPREERILYG